MRIVHIITSLGKGGAEEMLRRLLKNGDSEQRKNTLIITLTGEVKANEELKLYGYEVLSLKISGIISFLTGIIKLYIKIVKFKPHIMQTWLYHSDLIGGVIGRLALVPKVIWNIRCEALTVARAGHKTMVAFNLCKMLSYIIPSKIVCVGEKAKNTHIDAGFCKTNMTVIFNGYETDMFAFSQANRQKIRQELQIGEEDLVVGCIGRYHQDKGQDLLIKAAIEALQTTKNLKFVFVGRECSYDNPEIHEFNLAPDIKDKILMVGEKRNIAEILSSFDIYCMPSRSEGFPNSLAEAMLTELPCIATNVGDTSTLSGGTLAIVDPNRVDLILAKIKEYTALENGERKAMGQKARERVVSQFDIEKASENFNGLYRELLKH